MNRVYTKAFGKTGTFCKFVRTQFAFPVTTIPFPTQAALFERIKELHPEVNLAREIATLLNTGLDASYRRIRGETVLDLEQLRVIARHFRISLDSVIHSNEPGTVTFLSSSLLQRNLPRHGYFDNLLALLRQMRERKATEVIIANKDLPTFQLFQFPMLLRFKLFFWQKTMFDDPSLTYSRFSLSQTDSDTNRILHICQKIAEEYARINSTEVWNADMSTGLTRQIRYYLDTGLFEQPGDALLLLDEAETMFQALNLMASQGEKHLLAKPSFNGASYQIFHNDLIVNDNVMSVQVEDSLLTFHAYNSIEYIQTAHRGYGEHVRLWLENIPKRSDQISMVSERQRSRFFHKVMQPLQQLRSDIENELTRSRP